MDFLILDFLILDCFKLSLYIAGFAFLPANIVTHTEDPFYTGSTGERSKASMMEPGSA